MFKSQVQPKSKFPLQWLFHLNTLQRPPVNTGKHFRGNQHKRKKCENTHIYIFISHRRVCCVFFFVSRRLPSNANRFVTVSQTSRGRTDPSLVYHRYKVRWPPGARKHKVVRHESWAKLFKASPKHAGFRFCGEM